MQLRRSALWMIANKKDAAATATLVSVAKTDASTDLRAEATGFLGSIGGDEALAALEDLMKSDDDRVQRAAVRALTMHPSPARARRDARAHREQRRVNEQLRITALDAFNSDRSTLEDATWLRSIYAKVDNPRIKARIVSAVSRIGGDQNEQWLMSLAKNEDESIDVRQSALRFVARTADIAQPQQVLRRPLGAAAARGSHQRARQPQGAGGHGQAHRDRAQRHRSAGAPLGHQHADAARTIRAPTNSCSTSSPATRSAKKP